MKVYLAGSAEPALADHFRNIGCDVQRVSTSGIVAPPVSDHPDMFMCRMGVDYDSVIVKHPQLSLSLAGPDACSDPDRMISSGNSHFLEYPYDIAYNAACTGKYFVHNLRYTAPELIETARKLGITLLDVRQGYTKCSTVVVDENSIITYDHGIGKVCMQAGMDVLIVLPGHVLLPGYNTGFIGGVSGRVGDTVYFNGDLSMHPDHAKITEFIEMRGLRVIYFPDWPLTDIGTIYCE